jgi:CRP-like cAMP-binding protein
LLNEEERTATVKALSNVELIVISQENLIEIVNN